MQELAVIKDPNVAGCLLKPPRGAILEYLAKPDSAAGAARSLGLPRQQVAYHVRELDRHGLINTIARRRVRNCMERVVQASARRYLLSPESLGGLRPDPEEFRDRFSSAFLVASAARVAEDVGELRQEAEVAGLKLPTLSLKASVSVDSPAAQFALIEDLKRAFDRVVKRHHSPQGQRSFDLSTFAHPTRKTSSSEAST